jgi:anti-anti-sigma regulatory factor
MSLIDAIDVLPVPLITREPLTIHVVGVFDAHTTLRLRSDVVAAIADGPALVLLDLSDATRITPSAVAGMLEFLRMARVAGGDFRVYGESRALRKAHDDLRLTAVIRLYATKADAVSPGI